MTTPTEATTWPAMAMAMEPWSAMRHVTFVCDGVIMCSHRVPNLAARRWREAENEARGVEEVTERRHGDAPHSRSSEITMSHA